MASSSRAGSPELGSKIPKRPFLITNALGLSGSYGVGEIAKKSLHLSSEFRFGACFLLHVGESIAVSRILRQACLFVVFTTFASGQETVPKQDRPAAFEFEAPVIRESIFKDDLGLVDRERDEYASAIATFVANYVVSREADKASLEFARKALGLALHLSSRNKSAMVTKFQLSKGILPRKSDPEYSPKTLAGLFVTRAETLFEQKGEKSALIELAVTMDPHNEDSIYAYELQKIDYGKLNWGPFTEAPKPKLVKP